MIVAFPCSTFSAARPFKTNPPGPPAIRTKSFPDGLDAKDLDPKHAAELNRTKILLDRTIQLMIAARSSPKKTTIVLENPDDRSIPNTLPATAKIRKIMVLCRRVCVPTLERC